MKRSWVEISLSRLRSNLERVRRLVASDKPCRVMAVVKTDAYGHGLAAVTRALAESGVKRFAVAQIEEALQVRRLAPNARILVLGGLSHPSEVDEFRKNRLHAAWFEDRPAPAGLSIELKIDTGMTRLGVAWENAAQIAVRLAPSIAGAYSHFASADCDPEFTALQIARFEEATSQVSGLKHLANSAGLAYPQSFRDAVRPGLALYGIAPSKQVDGLKPCLSWKTRIMTVKTVPKGRKVGYAGTAVLERETRVGVLPVGYGDGYNRLLSNRGVVLVGTRTAPLLGRVSMDFLTVDLTEIPETSLGEVVTLLSDDPDSLLSASSMAVRTDTIPYETLTRIGNRVERRYVD